MANVHGLPGQYPKQQAFKRDQWMIWLLIAAVVYGMGGLGFVLGFFWARCGALAALGITVVLFCLRKPIERRADRFYGKLAKERLHFMRGGQGEALVGWLLSKLDGDWHVFNGMKLEAESDVDHIVVGPGGLFCVSTKSHRGLFTGTQEGLRHNGQPSPFAQEALRQTMTLQTRLKALMGAEVPWVQPVLAVPLGFTEGDACGGKVWLAHQDDLTDRLAPEHGPKRLKKRQVERMVEVLEMIEKSAAQVYRRPPAVTPPAK